MNIQVINIGEPVAEAPYSQAIKVDNFIFAAGQIGVHPKTGKLVSGGIKAETRQTLENQAAVLTAGGSSLDKVASTTVYLIDMVSDYAAMNEVYKEFFPKNPPARATVEVSRLAMGARVEIQLIAIV